MLQEIEVGMFKHVPVKVDDYTCRGCSFFIEGGDWGDCTHPHLHTRGSIGCMVGPSRFKAVPIEAKLPEGYTADELEKDNPYNQWMRVDTGVQDVPARSTDPATSKVWKDLSKYERVVVQQLTWHGGMTGKEIASAGNVPLNCITPRFAPLRRAGLIEASGLRRDKQTVWVLA